MEPKSMRSIEELVGIYDSGEGTLSMAEARLLDLHLFHKTGKRMPEFAKKASSKLPKTDFVISKSRKPNTETKRRNTSTPNTARVEAVIVSNPSSAAMTNGNSLSKSVS